LRAKEFQNQKKKQGHRKKLVVDSGAGPDGRILVGWIVLNVVR
jgi:hypothetical protein